MKSISNTLKVNISTRIIVVLVFSLTMFFNIGEAKSQQFVDSDDFISSNIKSMSNLNVLVQFNFEKTPVLEALEVLARHGGLELNYNKRSLNKDVAITKHLNGITLYEAIDIVSKDAGIHFYITKSGQMILTPEELPSNTGTLRGRVIDAESNETLVGATIYITELELGRAADAVGEFEMSGIPSGIYTLRVTSVGYKAYIYIIEIIANEELELDIRLEPDVAFLDQVVVTGYSIRQRSIPTGSVTRIEGSSFHETLIQSPDQALQGRSSGVYVSHSSGQPGSGLDVRIRGLGSINASNSPLYIIDGVQVRTDHTSALVADNALSSINANDIENIEVLKDASATALYGAQGANGVVLITTRQARRGQTQINVSSQVGFNEQPNNPELMDGPTWTDVMIQGYVNDRVDRGQDPEVARQDAINRYGDPATAQTYNWIDELTRAGALQKFNISATAGLDNTRIFLSGSYDYEEGAAIGSDFSSLRFRSNIDHSFNDRFTITTRLSLSNSTSNGLQAGSANINSPFHGGYTQRPIDAIYDEDGGYNHNDWIRVNLVQALNENIREATTRQFRGSVSGIYRIFDNLSLRSLWALDFRTTRDRSYQSALLPRYASTGGSLTERYRETESFNTSQVLEYIQNFNQHNVNLLGGFEYRKNGSSSFTASGEQFPNPVFSQLDLAAVMDGISGRSSESKFAGIFSRAEYDYENRYFVSATVRYDGSSRFGQQNQWGLFYSGAVAWDIARELFMSDIRFVDQLKLRTSYGITGNSGISDFAARSLFGAGGDPYGGNTGLRPTGLGNDLLTWEEAQTFDIGIEFAVLGDRIYGDINWFKTRNKNLLLNAWLPTDSGFSSITRNSGIVENTGWEFELGARVITTNNFRWSSDFNITFQDNEIIELVDGLDILGSSVRVGYPIDIIWTNEFAGINPSDGRVMWYDQDGEITYTRSSSDQKMMGKYSPDFYGGLTNNFSYRNVSLRAFFQYEYGRSTYNSSLGYRMHAVSSERGIVNRVATDAWQQPGDMTDLPRHYTSSSFPGSSSHTHASVALKDASYIRLKELTLNYNLPSQWIEKINLTRANVFVQGRNVLTWTKYPYQDPEVVGTATGEYPQSRQFSLGINFQF